MRQLKISKQPTDPAWEVEKAQALPLLRSLAATQPLGLAAEAEEKLLRFIVSMATQYRGRGVAWEALLRAGFEAAFNYLAQKNKQPEYLGWWVRQEMLKSLQIK